MTRTKANVTLEYATKYKRKRKSGYYLREGGRDRKIRKETFITAYIKTTVVSTG